MGYFREHLQNLVQQQLSQAQQQTQYIPPPPSPPPSLVYPSQLQPQQQGGMADASMFDETMAVSSEVGVTEGVGAVDLRSIDTLFHQLSLTEPEGNQLDMVC